MCRQCLLYVQCKQYLIAELARPHHEVQIQDLHFHSGSFPRILTRYNFDFSAACLFFPREYFVLTTAGKPVFVRYVAVPIISSLLTFLSRPGAGDQSGMASAIGIMQALISVFLDDNDKLRSINAGRTRITFLLRPPLYYVCASSWGEPESVVRCVSRPTDTSKSISLLKEDTVTSRIPAPPNSQHCQRESIKTYI